MNVDFRHKPIQHTTTHIHKHTQTHAL